MTSYITACSSSTVRSLSVTFALLAPAQLCCSGGQFISFLADVSMTSLNVDHQLTCELPSYVYISGILCSVSVSAFLKLSALVKLALMSVMSATFILIMEFTHKPLFVDFDQRTQ